MRIRTIGLTEYLLQIGDESGSFSTEQSHAIFKRIIEENVDFNGNMDMNTYVLEKAIQFEKHHRSRNFIVENIETNDIVGFFSLSLKVVDISALDKAIKKRLILKGKSPNTIEAIPVLLIGQFGKNTKISRSITGERLFQEVLEKIELFRSVVGTQMVFLDSINHPKIISFYERMGFFT